MKVQTARIIVFVSAVVFAFAFSACNGIYLPPPSNAQVNTPTSLPSQPETSGEGDAMPPANNQGEMDVFNEMVSIILDAPGSDRYQLDQIMVAAKIANAMSAAPLAVSKDATIIDFPASASDPAAVLREGTNGWTCYTDWPGSPGDDPECNDPVFEAWLGALFAGEEAPPEISAPGIAYMLMGGSDPSNTDPMAAEPAADEDWVTSPAHVMLVVPGGFDTKDFTTDPYADQPWIMWEGTAFEHLMIPVDPINAEEMGDADAAMRTTMSAAPAGVIRHATIFGDPTTEGGEMVTLQEGDGDWVCWPDRTVSPDIDPMCSDAMWNVWNDAYAAGIAPELTTAGIGYMLAGGSDESNTDPMATGPAPGDDWIVTPAHIMLLVPGGFDANHFTTDFASGYPYIMWDGTPYEHLMLPVADRSN